MKYLQSAQVNISKLYYTRYVLYIYTLCVFTVCRLYTCIMPFYAK